MKPKILMVFLAVLMLCLGSTTFAFANDTNNAQETNSEFSIPVFDSIQEAEAALNEENNIQPLAIGDEGGTQICIIYPYIVRQNSLTEKCQLYLKYESDLRVQSIRFKELIVESEYIGIII